MDSSGLHNQRKLILIAAAVGIISAFLPWINAFIVTVNGLHGKGTVAFIAFIGAAVVSVMGKWAEPLDKAMWMVALIAGAVALLFTVLFMSDLSGLGNFGTGMGIGIWISLLASLGVLASAWLLKSSSDSLQGGFDSLKNKISSNLNSSTTTGSTGSSKVDELEKLIKLKDEGKITEEEYQQLKSKIL